VREILSREKVRPDPVTVTAHAEQGSERRKPCSGCARRRRAACAPADTYLQ